MGNIRYGDGKNAVIVSDDMDRMIRRMLDRVAPTITRELENATAKLESSASKQWPVKTGEARASFDRVLRLSTSKLEAVLTNRAKHVFFIRSDKIGKQRKLLVPVHVWTERVRKPGEKMAQPLADKLAADLRKLSEPS